MFSARLKNKYSLSPVKYWAYVLAFLSLMNLQACVAPIAAIGASGSAVASSAGATVATAAAANPMTATSLASTATTGKSPLEQHAASAATKKECSFFNVVDSKPICIDVVLPPVTDKSTPLLGPNDLPTETR
ncbi:hypothetical protein [Polynucleobacter necessarius]|uniref:hypothetical protein n=1 Tax=Polynucleobacter necessarius TaxID=576610 RepID=UPI000FE27606|nr:hypothetical protein [Polynucleobacter necessarius]